MKNYNNEKVLKIFRIETNAISKEFYLLGLPILKIFNPAKSNYKRHKIRFCGVKFTFKTKTLKKLANKYNFILNKKNLSLYPPEKDKNHILFVVSDFTKVGGVETRVGQYTRKLLEEGWNVSILSEKNENKDLALLRNFYLVFSASNINECLNEIIDKFNINTVEFQFKSHKILQYIDITQLKKKVKVGGVFHNLGVENKKVINNFDYKIMVSKYMYENVYQKDILNAEIIQNSIDTTHLKSLPVWEYKGQKTALFISRISNEKLNSIECFIKYCQEHNIDFKIAGKCQNSDSLKKMLIRKFNLSEETFIGQIDTMDYLSKNINDILFIGGLGLVILESLYMGYPSFCCSDYSGKNYSFVTASNIMLFDNFTIYKGSMVSELNKKVFYPDMNNLSDYCLRDYIVQNRDLSINFEKYLNIIK